MSPIEFTRVKNDINGNPRYVVHFLNLLSKDELLTNSQIGLSVIAEYKQACQKAKQLGGRKYTGKDFGGGIVFQSYNTRDLEKRILELVNG